MIDTWIHMNMLRNYFNHPRDAEKIEKVLRYFEEPIEIPINPNSLWNKILKKFEDSLYECINILNNLTVSLPESNKVKLNVRFNSVLLKKIDEIINTPHYRFDDRSYFLEKLVEEWIQNKR